MSAAQASAAKRVVRGRTVGKKPGMIATPEFAGPEMTSPADRIYRVLFSGIFKPRGNYLRNVELVEAGLPVRVIDRLAEKVAPDNRKFVYTIVSSATLARRRKAAKRAPKKALLSTEESARAMRVARVFERALSVWKGEEAARQFLNSPHMLLENRTPLDVATKTDEGARVVEEVLGKLEHGTAL